MSDVVEKVKEYFFKSSLFEETFVGWAQEHAHVIDLTTTENKLEYTPLHNEFLAFFEKQLEGVIAECGSTVEDFYAKLREIMLAAVEYEMFIGMMREIAQEVATKK